MAESIDLRHTYINEPIGTTMHKEQYFGEIALLRDVKRQASIFSLTECILAYIDKEDFDRVLKHLHKQDLQK